jgi:anaerobic selenocysteine-containing dehydrogenase
MTFQSTVCPHDCPSCCALEVDVLDSHRIGAVRGAADNTYTAGVICAKVARYAERQHHPDRLTTPLLRTGPKGSGQFRPISWDEALDRTAAEFKAITAEHGAEAVWPYYFAGTMGLVQRDGINRLRHAMGYSRQKNTICSTIAEAGWVAGAGRIVGPDSREMPDSDLIIMWGGNPVATQVNVMTHVTRARKTRGAKFVVVDPYRSGTAAAADIHLALKPGTDGALACAVMHAAFRDGYADREYMAQYADFPEAFEAHLATRTPAWAAGITGLSEAEIESFALLYNSTSRSYIRVGYGFSRHRNGAAMLHAVTCMPTVTGAWKNEGGGAFWSARGIYGFDKTLIEGLDVRDTSVRELDMSRIASVLTGSKADLGDGPKVHALFIQNTNPMVVAPDSNKVRRGFERDDLFVVVHEQFMTETALMADIVLPATTFLEHDDFYQGGAHTHVQIGRKLVEPPGECRSNHDVLQGLAVRLGADHPGFKMTALEMVDATLRKSGYPGAEAIIADRWLDKAEDFRKSHHLDGFGHPGGKFRFAPDWAAIGPGHAAMPRFADHMEVFDHATPGLPYRLVTAPARQFLNTSFTETPTAKKREGRPTAMLHAKDAAKLGVRAGDRLRLGNSRGEVVLHAVIATGQQEGTIIVESVWPNAAFEGGVGINALISDEAAFPNGGAVFHDTAVWAKAEAMATALHEDALAAE